MERPSLCNVLGTYDFFFDLESVLTSEAPLSLRGFFQSVQGNQSWVSVVVFHLISLGLVKATRQPTKTS